MRRGTAIAVVVLLGVAAGVAWMLRDRAEDVVAAAPEEDGPAAVDAAGALAVRARTRGADEGAMGSQLPATIVGTVRRDGKPVVARVALHPVVRAQDGEPLSWAEARIDWGIPSGDPAFLEPLTRTTSGADGGFRASVPAPGLYTVVASDDDGAFGQASARAASGGAHVEVSIELRWGAESLTGRVLRADGRPFEGFVAADPATDGYSYFSLRPVRPEADGRFTLRGFAPGPYSILAYIPGRLAVQTRTILVPHVGDVVVTVDAASREVDGRVVSDTDGRAVVGAEVTATSWSVLGLASFHARATTDGDGRFRLEAPVGSCSWHVRATGYATLATIRSHLAEGVVELRLVRAGKIAGRVTLDGDGTPVAGVRVFGRTGDDDASETTATTDAQGRYALGDVPPGEVTVFAFGAGYVSKGLSSWRHNGWNPFSVAVDPDAVLALDLVVVRAGTAKGSVVDATGKPVEGAVVSAHRVVPGDNNDDTLAVLAEAGAVATDAAGAFALDTLLLDTSYQFECTVGRGVPGRAGPFRIEAGRPPPTVAIRLGAPRWAEVRCRTKDDRPVVGASVAAYRQADGRWDQLASGITGGQGTARLGPLAPGPITMNVWCQGYRVDGESNPVLGGDGDDMADLEHNYVLEPTQSVAGVVRWSGGEPGAGLVVAAKAEGWQSTTWLDDDGAFSFSNVPAGGVELKVTDPGAGEDALLETRAKGGEDALVLTVPKAKPPRWSFRVVGPDGRPVVWASYTLAGEGFNDSGVVAEGKVEAAVPEAEVHVFVHSPQGVAGRPLAAGWVIAGPFPAKSPPAEIRLPAELAITGMVEDADGRPVRGVGVSAVPVGLPPPFAEFSDGIGWTRTDAQGRFRIGRLAAGTVKLEVTAPDSAGATEPVEVKAGTANVVIKLAAGKEYRVVVVDADGVPVEGATVSVERPSGTLWTETDSAGVASLRGLDPEARYDVSAAAPLARLDCLDEQVKGWRPGESPLTLPRALAIRGVVRDPTGRPLPRAIVERLGADGDVAQRTSCARDGTFALTRVPEGDAKLVARLEDPPLASAVVASRAGAENVLLTLTPTVALRITFEGWKPAERAWVNLTDEDSGRTTPWAMVDPTGVVNMAGVRTNGTYALYASFDPDDGPGLVAAKTGIVGDAGAITIALAPAQAIGGRLLAPPGCTGWRVWAEQGKIHRNAGTDDDEHTFVVSGLAPGRWTLHAQATVGEQTWTTEAEVDAGASGVVLDPKPPR